MLRIWNTRHRALEEFASVTPGKVGLYNCGPTVYNPVTIGNLRAYTFVDVLKRTLQVLGYEVRHVMNITDVGHLVGDGDVGEDKMEREAKRQGQTAWDIARMYEARALADEARLNILPPDVLPRATEHVAEQIALVQALEAAGFTYRAADGIYFDTAKFPAYGSLSGQKLEEKAEGARVAIREDKRNPTDFALWKFSPTDGTKRQMEWESPWGIGFPGWHIECSAMSVKYLGQPFDIHAGGMDLIPVHHENEIAQSEAIQGTPLARYWMHNEFLTVDGRRMGKSEGNAYTLDDLMARGHDPLAFRYLCLNAHYRSKLNFTWEGVAGAESALQHLRQLARALPSSGEPNPEAVSAWRTRFIQALEDDVNTPAVLAVVWECLKSEADPVVKAALLREMDQVLGLGVAELIGVPFGAPAEVVALAEERVVVRQAKDWAASDRLRDAIAEKGWKVEDRKDGGFSLTPM